MAGAVHAHNVGVSLLSRVGEDLSFLLFVSFLSQITLGLYASLHSLLTKCLFGLTLSLPKAGFK
jgi:hypothetical protein